MQYKLDRDSITPLYVQIGDIIRHGLSRGVWKPGERIPSESELQESFHVSRMTVRGVVSSLVDEGLLQRVPGKGTFVAQTKITASSPMYRGIREQLERMGYKTQTELLKFEKVLPPRFAKDALEVAEDESVFEIVRLRKIEDQPVSLHRSWIPAEFAPSLLDCDVVDEQLCTVLSDEFGLRAAETHETLEAVAASEVEGEILECGEGVPLLLLEDTLYDERGRAFEYTKLLLHGGHMKLRFNFSGENKAI